jgi:hypothetical protein
MDRVSSTAEAHRVRRLRSRASRRAWRRDRLPVRSLVVVLLLLLALRPLVAVAESEEDRRAQAGIRLFRSLLAADLDLENKRGEDGKLLLVVFHTGNRDKAEELAKALAGAGADPDPIKGLPVAIELGTDPAFASHDKHPPAGIFLAQAPSPQALQTIVRYGIDHHVIVYSPFEGHVEKGVLAGLAVEAQVRPYVNRETLAASHIELKAFFMKVTKVYP